MELKHPQIIIKGAGDLASGVAVRLFKCGYLVLMTELAKPTSIRTTVSFSQAVYDGSMEIEGVGARRAAEDEALAVMGQGFIPVMPAPTAYWLESLAPQAFIEATLSKKNTGLSRYPGRLTIALGPGYRAGRDCEAVVETARGHFLGSLIYEGEAAPDSGRPGDIGGFTVERLLRAPAAGKASFTAKIGDWAEAGQILGMVGSRPIKATMAGVLRGAINNGLEVPENFKIGDIDPRPEAAAFIHSPSDKARAIAGAALEAILAYGILPGRAG